MQNFGWDTVRILLLILPTTIVTIQSVDNLATFVTIMVDRKNKFYEDFITSPTTENDIRYKKMKKFVRKKRG